MNFDYIRISSPPWNLDENSSDSEWTIVDSFGSVKLFHNEYEPKDDIISLNGDEVRLITYSPELYDVFLRLFGFVKEQSKNGSTLESYILLRDSEKLIQKITNFEKDYL